MVNNPRRRRGLRYPLPKVIDTGHACHAAGCDVSIPPSMFMCFKHWKMLPKPLRDDIWRLYRRGQENTKNPSAAYLAAAKNAIKWMAEHEGVQLTLRL